MNQCRTVVFISRWPFKSYITEVGVVSHSRKKRVTKPTILTLLALQGGGWVSISRGGGRYVTLEWPLGLI